MLTLGIVPRHEVLFPGMKVPVRLVEDVDQQMFVRLEGRDESCGVVLASEGRDQLQLHQAVGTVARVISVRRVPDGSLEVVLLGVGRFRIVEIVGRSEPYPIAAIRPLGEDSEDSERCRHLASEVAASFVEYLATLLTLANRSSSEITLPSQHAALSYAIAASLPLRRAEQQHLLETNSVAERLRRELAILRRERGLLGNEVLRRSQAHLRRLSVN